MYSGKLFCLTLQHLNPRQDESQEAGDRGPRAGAQGLSEQVWLRTMQSTVGWGGDASIFSLMNSRPSRSKLEKCGPGLKVPLLETWKICQRHNPHLIQDSRKQMIWFQRVKGKYRSFQIHIKSLSCRTRLIPASLPWEEDSPGLQVPDSWHPSETPRTLSLEEYLF